MQYFTDFVTDIREDDMRAAFSVLNDLAVKIADIQKQLSDFDVRLKGASYETDAQYRKVKGLEKDIDEIYRCVFNR